MRTMQTFELTIDDITAREVTKAVKIAQFKRRVRRAYRKVLAFLLSLPVKKWLKELGQALFATVLLISTALAIFYRMMALDPMRDSLKAIFGAFVYALCIDLIGFIVVDTAIRLVRLHRLNVRKAAARGLKKSKVHSGINGAEVAANTAKSTGKRVAASTKPVGGKRLVAKNSSKNAGRSGNEDVA